MTLSIGFDPTQCVCAHDMSNRLILIREWLLITWPTYQPTRGRGKMSPWAETWRWMGGQKKISRPNFRKNFHFQGKNFWRLFFSSSDFPFLFSHFPYVYYVKCRIWPFPHKKTTIFHSVHTFTHIRQHYFSKYWGDQCVGRPPHLTFFWGPSPIPPRSPPLSVPMMRSIHEQCILRAPAIALSDHRAVYDAKCGRPPRGRGVGQMRTGGMKRGHFCGCPLWTTPLYKWNCKLNRFPDSHISCFYYTPMHMSLTSCDKKWTAQTYPTYKCNTTNLTIRWHNCRAEPFYE